MFWHLGGGLGEPGERPGGIRGTTPWTLLINEKSKNRSMRKLSYRIFRANSPGSCYTPGSESSPQPVDSVLLCVSDTDYSSVRGIQTACIMVQVMEIVAARKSQ